MIVILALFLSFATAEEPTTPVEPTPTVVAEYKLDQAVADSQAASAEFVEHEQTFITLKSNYDAICDFCLEPSVSDEECATKSHDNKERTLAFLPIYDATVEKNRKAQQRIHIAHLEAQAELSQLLATWDPRVMSDNHHEKLMAPIDANQDIMAEHRAFQARQDYLHATKVCKRRIVAAFPPG